MIHFLKLIRIVNLLIIVFTMIGVADYLMITNGYQYIEFDQVEYGILVASIVFIAAGGNMINDYFDLKADRINKPERVIVSRFIKKRWVIILHWSINIIALIISIYLSYKYATLLFVFVHLISINALWFYSIYFKRKLLIGNLIIAGLTGIVPILAVWYFKTLNETGLKHSPYHEHTWSNYLDYHFVYFIAFAAFMMNLSREIVKDAQDIEGDKAIGALSLPMKLGLFWSNILALIILQLPALLGIYLFKSEWFVPYNYESYFLAISALINACTLVGFLCVKKPSYKFIHLLIKLSMFIGLLSLFCPYFP